MTLPLRPTTRGTVMLLAAAGALGVAMVNVSLTSCMAASLICAIVFISFLLSLFSLSGIEVQRGPTRDGFMGTTISLPLVVVNRARRIRQALVIREHCPFTDPEIVNAAIEPLTSREKRYVVRQIKAIKRGFYNLDKVTLLSGDPAGLFARCKTFKLPGEIQIYPDSVKLSWMPIRIYRQIQVAAAGRPLGASGIGQELFGVREYRPSDGVRFIHWKASAKQRKMMVREFEANSVSRVIMVLDVEKKFVGLDPVDSNFEFLVKTAASITSYLSQMYCRMLYLTGDNKGGVTMFSGDTAAISKQIMYSLTTVVPNELPLLELIDTQLDFFRTNSILYCLSMSEPRPLQHRFEQLVERGVEVRWIYAPAKYFPFAEVKRPVRRPVAAEQIKSTIVPYVAWRSASISRMLMYG